MTPDQSADAFRKFLAAKGLVAGSLTFAEGLDQMTSFYTRQDVEGVLPDTDGDMLLFQWGTYDWTGTGPAFQLNLTRQFIIDDG